MKFVFTPFSLILGLLAGLAGKKIFEKAWSTTKRRRVPNTGSSPGRS
jgi:hypothetical protein